MFDDTKEKHKDLQNEKEYKDKEEELRQAFLKRGNTVNTKRTI